jgi:glycosyltransferase involved in cell wall biosynthesis
VPDPARLVARLGSELPSRLAVGKGTVVLLDGICRAAGAKITGLRVRIGENESRARGFDLPRPGSVARGDYWWAIVPVDPVRAPTHAAASLAAETSAGPLDAYLGGIRLQPGVAVGPGDEVAEAGAERAEVAICMAAFDPDLELFRRQVASIRNQTVSDWVCVISDDGSAPAKLDGMREVVGDDPRFRIVPSEKRLGFYGNFERALSLAPTNARLVGLADQDDRWVPHRLETLKCALDRGAVLAYSDMRLIDRDGSVLSDTFWRYRRNNHTDLLSLLLANTITGTTTLFRRDLLDAVLPFPPPVADTFHDHWLALNALASGRVAYVQEPLVDYVQHQTAAIGHAGANRAELARGAAGALARGRRRMAELRVRRMRPGWRSHYFNLFCQMAVLARVLDRRWSGALDRDRRSELGRFVDADASLRSSLWLAGKALIRRFDPRVTLKRERYVLRGLAWLRLARLRERLRRGQDQQVAGVQGSPDMRGGRPNRLIPIVIDHSGRDGSTAFLKLLSSSPLVITSRILPRVDPAADEPYFAYLWRWARLPDVPPPATTSAHGVATHADPATLLEDRGTAAIGPPPWPDRDLLAADGERPFGDRALHLAWNEFSERAAARASAQGQPRPRYYAERHFDAWRIDLSAAAPLHLLMLLRDPRDTYSSMLAYELGRGMIAPEQIHGAPARTRAMEFIGMHRDRLRWIAELPDPEATLVRYERLVLDTAAVATQIGGLLGLQLDPAAVTEDRTLQRICATAPSASESIGRWRRELHPEVAELFRSEIGDELRALGFEP